MRKQVITTIVLLAATIGITVLYFKNLSPPGSRTSQVINSIPDDAAVIFEFNNEQGFYDIFSNNTLLNSAIGQPELDNIDTLRKVLLGNPLLEKFFTGQNVFVSLHPLKNSQLGLLLTIPAAKGFDVELIGQIVKQQGNGIIITPMESNGKQGFNIYINSIKKRFYVIANNGRIFSGSFSPELAALSAGYKPKSEDKAFTLLPEQQSSASLANLYVNYEKLPDLFGQLFGNKNSDIFRGFKALPARAELSMNYKNEAFMFSGVTTIQHNEALSYFTLFADQQPVESQLKDFFPATTAYSTSFAVSDPIKFVDGLGEWHTRAGIKAEKDALFGKVKAETGVNLRAEFNKLLGTEFAIVTTRYQEKFAIVSVSNGSKLRPYMVNISRMINDDVGQFNFEKLPFFLLGDAFSIFKHPYFIIIDNYLILANTPSELASYKDTYLNRKFLSKMETYNSFDALVSERSNISFFINFKNTQAILKRDLNAAFYDAFENDSPGWKNFYGASYQFSASDKNFYTNFCMRLNNVDTLAVKGGLNGQVVKQH